MGIGSPFNQQLLSALSDGGDKQIAQQQLGPLDPTPDLRQMGGAWTMAKQTPPPGSPGSDQPPTLPPAFNQPATNVPSSGMDGYPTAQSYAQTGNPMTQQLGFPSGQNNASTPSGGSGSGGVFSGGGGGKQSLSLGQVGLTFDPSGGGGGATQSFAGGGIASLGAGNMGFMHPAMGGVSQQEETREIDIINAYFRQANIPPQQSIRLLQAAVQSGVQFKRAGNTMMGFKPLPPSSAQVYFFSIDPPPAFAQAAKQLLGGLKQSGVQSIYMNKVDPTIMQTLQSIGVAAQQSDRPEYKVKAAI